jgi:hypothetical protein
MRDRSNITHDALPPLRNTETGAIFLFLLSLLNGRRIAFDMARLTRLVIPGLPHHVTQRGNGRAQNVLLGGGPRYVSRPTGSGLQASRCRSLRLDADAQPCAFGAGAERPGWLRCALAPVHRRYAGHVNAQERRRGHFWQGRFGAVVWMKRTSARRWPISSQSRSGRDWSGGRRTGIY